MGEREGLGLHDQSLRIEEFTMRSQRGRSDPGGTVRGVRGKTGGEWRKVCRGSVYQ